MGKPILHAFIVNTGSLPTLNANRIEAAYYRTENGFTTFKDADNQAVFTVRDDHLVSIERANEATPIADLRRLLAEADRSMSAVTGEFVSHDTDPDGRVHETAYRVQVEAVQGNTSDLPNSAVHVQIEGKLDEGALRQAVQTGARRYGQGRA